MAETTHADFNARTEGLEVANAFAGQIHGKTVLVTGVNQAGIGYTIAEAFASQSPAHLIVAGRTESKLLDSIASIKTKYPNNDCQPLLIDLSDQESVRSAAAELLSRSSITKIDIIVNSAGVFSIPERTLTKQGIEMHLGTNHIGHFLFTNLLMPKLIATSSSSEKGATRIINVSSGSPMASGIRWSDLNFDKKNKDLPAEEYPNVRVQRMFGFNGDIDDSSYLPTEAYNQSKVANVLYSIGLNKRLFESHGILSVAVHPGIIKTELGRTFPEDRMGVILEMDRTIPGGLYKSQGAGASTALVAALDPKLTGLIEKGEMRDEKENYGVFMMDCQVTDKADKRAVGSAEAERLWGISEGMVGEKFSW